MVVVVVVVVVAAVAVAGSAVTSPCVADRIGWLQSRTGECVVSAPCVSLKARDKMQTPTRGI